MISFFKILTRGLDFVTAQNYINIPTDELKPIQYGEQVPDFDINTVNGKTSTLYSLLEKSPVVLSFFRGTWCMTCNVELNALQKEMKEFDIKNIQLIGISPEGIENSKNAIHKKELSFELVSDPGNKIASLFDIVVPLKDVMPPIGKNTIEKHLGGKIEEFEVPIPATYIIGRHGTVMLSYIDYDFTKRVKPSDIHEIITVAI